MINRAQNSYFGGGMSFDELYNCVQDFKYLVFFWEHDKLL